MAISFKLLAKNTALYALGPQLPKVFGLILLPVFTEYLTADDYGVIGVIVAYTTLLNAVGELGFSVLLMNSFFKYSRNRWKILWRRYYGILTVWSIPYGILLSYILYHIIPDEAVENRLEIILAYSIPVFLFNITNLFAMRVYQYSSKPAYLTVVSVISGFFGIFLNYYLIVELRLGYMSWVYSSFAVSCLTFAMYLYPLINKYGIYPSFRIPKNFIVDSLKVALPVLPHSYSNYLLNTSDRLVMDQLNISTKNIGGYSFAYTIGSYVDVLSNAVGTAMVPVYGDGYQNEKNNGLKKLSFLTKWMQIGIILACGIIALWMKEIFDLIVRNDELKSFYYLAIIVVLSYTYRPYYWAVTSRLQFSSETKHLWKISFTSGIINVILNLIFIPIYGFAAAAVTTFISLMFNGFFGFCLKGFKNIESQVFFPMRYLISIVGVGIITWVCKEVDILIKIVGSIIAVFITYLKYRVDLKSMTE